LKGAAKFVRKRGTRFVRLDRFSGAFFDHFGGGPFLSIDKQLAESLQFEKNCKIEKYGTYMPVQQLFPLLFAVAT
jgi:hypothetical protein